MKYSNIEKKELFIAGLLISLAFAILLSGGFESLIGFNTALLIAFVVAFFTAGIGFLFHELMHKYVGQRYGYWAEFRAYYGGLWLALGLSLFGFILAVPGAVHIHNHGRIITKEKNGKISLAGPVTNIVLALVFLIGSLFFNQGVLGILFSYGLSINSLLAAFNMIPVNPFDGAKIKEWSLGVYSMTVVIAVGLFVASWFI